MQNGGGLRPGRQRTRRSPLRGEVGDSYTVDWLLSRALIVDESDRVRFPTRTVRDARAARALLSRHDGAAILSQYGIATVGDERRLRPHWAYLVDLLLSSDRDAWSATIDPADPLAVARSTPPDDSEDARSRAVLAIVRWNRSHRLLLERTAENQLWSDLDAIVAIEGAGLSRYVIDELVNDLSSPHFPVRANASVVLGRLGYAAELGPELDRLLVDQEPVVRRWAAEAISYLGHSSYAVRLAELANQETDDLAQRTLANVAVEIATVAELPTIVVALRRELRQEAFLTINRRWNRREQLDFLGAQQSVDKEWLEDIARYSTGAAWSHDDIRDLAALWSRADFSGPSRPIRDVLAENPTAALQGAFDDANDAPELVDIWFLMEALAEQGGLSAIQQMGQHARDAVDEWQIYQARRSGDRPPVRRSAAAPRTPISELIRSGDVAAILNRRADVTASDLDDADRARLRQLIASEWAATSAAEGSPMANIERTSPHRWRSRTAKALPLLDWAATISLEMSRTEWIGVANLGMYDGSEIPWLKETFCPEWMRRSRALIRGLNEAGLRALIRAAPPLKRRSAKQILRHCRRLAKQPSPTLDGQPSIARTCAERFERDGHLGLVRRLAERSTDDELDDILVRTIDPQAEARLMTAWNRDGYPNSPDWRAGHHWLDELNHQATAPLIAEALSTMLRRGAEQHDLMRLFTALNRCAGESALSIYDSLIADEHIPHSSSLWYRREECFQSLSPLADRDPFVIAGQLFSDSSPDLT